MKIISGTWKIKNEFLAEFVIIAKEAVAFSIAEKGNISFNFTEHKMIENTFLFFEEWKDQKAINFHISQIYFKEFMEKSKIMIESKPIIKVYNVSNQKEL